MMIEADVCEGGGVSAASSNGFLGRIPLVDSFIHLHNAKRGCFSCRVERAD